MIIRNYTIGADPELFIINTKTNKVISSIGLIPGEKGKPYVAPDMPDGFGIEIDNILGEFNIPPCSSKREFIENINYMKNYIDKYVKNINSDYGIKCIASQFVDEDQLNHPIAKLFGCSVDYNAYTLSENPKPKGESTNLRSAGFHIHFGYNNCNVDDSIKLIKLFDLCLGIPSIIHDPDTKRRSLYGKAGAFRLCEYGFEYRVLSSAMMSNDTLLDVIWDGIKKAVCMFNNEEFVNDDRIITAINNSDIELAKTIIEEYNI